MVVVEQSKVSKHFGLFQGNRYVYFDSGTHTMYHHKATYEAQSLRGP